MSGAIHNQEFWQAPVAASVASTPPTEQTLVQACDRCGTEFIIGAGFCHVCGAPRTPQPTPLGSRHWARALEFSNIKKKLGLNTTSLVAFLIGVGCVVAALLVGLIFTASTVLDWQAVQVWRIQWLLASAASFLAAILLKSPRN
jgi:ribosomal protein L37E